MSHLEITMGLFVLFLVYTSRFQSLKGLFHQIFLHMSTPLFLAGSFHNFFPHMSHILIFSYRFIYSHAVLLCRNAGYKNPASGSPAHILPQAVPRHTADNYILPRNLPAIAYRFLSLEHHTFHETKNNNFLFPVQHVPRSFHKADPKTHRSAARTL